MNEKLLKELQAKLEEKKEVLIKELRRFAKKDESTPHDWDTKYPKFAGESIEDAADEVEEYSNLLPVEHSFELRLKDVNDALDRIKKGTYGICENCGKEIPEDRLRISPEARTCLDCERKR